MLSKLFTWFFRWENITALKAIRRALTLTIPVLLVGSFCVVLLNLPIPIYLEFIARFPMISEFLLGLHSITLGVFCLYVVISIGLAYSQAYAEKHGDFFMHGTPIAALAAYLACVGIGNEGFSVSVFSTRSLFIAIIAGLLASAFYCKLVARKRSMKPGRKGSDSFFNRALASVVPFTIVAIVAVLFNQVVCTLSGASSVEEFFFEGMSGMFSRDASMTDSGYVFIFLTNLFWFFGIHGGNVLDGVAQSVFADGTGHIFTKTFFDVFVSIGGAGAIISLLIAVLIFGRQQSMKKLSGLAAGPIIFNINEIMLFGFPVIWNPVMLIPFLLVPMVNLTIAYFATSWELVPIVTNAVEWTTPPLIGGYQATGSYAGVALQVVNIVIGVFIYLPFLRLYEKVLQEAEKNEYAGLLSRFRESELERGDLVLTAMPGTIGLLVRALSDDLRVAIQDGTFDMYYQPQFDINDNGIGAEALLRWNHPVHGMMYPPLVVQLAEEIGLIEKLEEAVVKKAIEDAERIQRLSNAGLLRQDFAISVNATARALQNDSFVDKLIAEFKDHGLDPGRLIVEATEHDALNFNDEMSVLLDKMVDAGIPLAIDDFSMGHTSFKYLETSAFSIVKLDGTIAKGVMGNSRYADIVSSITKLSEQLCFKVLAEYVETKEQRDELAKLGCSYFQGYLYSPAVPFDDMLEIVQIGAEAKNIQ